MNNSFLQSNAFQQLKPVAGVAHKSITVSSTALGIGALHSQTKYVLLTVNTEGVRCTFDGSAPTSTDGHLLAAGAERLLSLESAVALKMIRATNDANVAVSEFTR